jgi:long-chain fatty acid transport protein
VHSYLGLGFDYGSDWAGSRMIEEARLESLNVTPAVSWRATDDVDVGVSVNAQRAETEVAMGISNDAQIYGPPAGLPDGSLRFDGDSWALGVNIGVLYRPDSATRLGVTWTSSTQHEFELDVAAANLHPLPAAMLASVGVPQLEASFPQQLLLSGVRQVTPSTSIAASVAWQEWSSFGEANLEVAPARRSFRAASRMPGTYPSACRLLTPQWTIATGLAYDTDPAGGEPVPIYFPVSDQLRAALGIEYQLREVLTVRLSYSMLSQGDIRVDPQDHPLPLPGMTPVSGRISGSQAHAVGIAFERSW